MKTTLIFALTFATAFASLADEPVTHEFLAAVYRANHTYVIDKTTASSAGGAIVRCGNTYLTPEGAYVQIKDTFLKPGGGAVVNCRGSYVGTANASARVGSGINNIAFVGSDGASFGAGDTILRPLIAH